LRRLLTEFIAAVRERPFSYKIAHWCQTEPTGLDVERLRALYDRTDYLMGRVVLADAVRRHRLPIPDTFLRHIARTANRYILKNVLLTLRHLHSSRSLVTAAKHPICQDDSLMRHLVIEAARAQGIDPNHLDIYVNTEQAEFSEEETRTWRLWKPLDETLAAVNEARGIPADTLRLMLYENREPLADELARDLSDVFNISPREIPHLAQRRLTSLLMKYVDLSYQVSLSLAEGDFDSLEDRLAEESETQPPGILIPTSETDRGPTRQSDLVGMTKPREFEETSDDLFPEDSMMEGEEEGDSRAGSPGSFGPGEAGLTADDIHFDPVWKRLIPRMLAEELLIIPMHVEGEPAKSITVGCGSRDHAAVFAHLGNLGCAIHCVHLPANLVREAIRLHYA
jgi:hypothetical protein